MSQPPPPIPPITPELLESSLQILLPLSEILQRLHYRNKNQHSSSRWWSAFDILRRNTDKFVREMEGCLDCAPRENKKGKGVKARKWEEGVERVVKRAVFMREGVLVKGWEGFGGVVGDRRFSPLGLGLVGVLGGMRRVVGEILGEEVGEGGMEGEGVMGGEIEGGEGMVVVEGEGEVDMGERVEREVVVVSVEELPKMAKEKRRVGGGGGDEFDDIFGSLGGRKSGKKRAIEERGTPLLDDNENPSTLEPANSKVSKLEPDDSDGKPPPQKPAGKKKKQSDEFDDAFGELGEDKPRRKKKKVIGDEFDDIFGGLGEDKPKKKRKKATGDEFDDIFGGLGEEKPKKKVGVEKKKKKKRDEFDDIFAGF